MDYGVVRYEDFNRRKCKPQPALGAMIYSLKKKNLYK